MKVIGLIGGMSWNSTLEYYRIINESFARRLGGLHSARLVLYNLDFDEIQRAQYEGRWDDLAGILIDAGNAVKRAGADFLLICTNTMHKVADDVEQKVDLPLVHIVDVIGTAVKERQMNRVGLLGTRFLLEGHLYQDRLRDRFAIEVQPLMHQPERYDRVADLPTNNAYLLGIQRYNLDLDVFGEIFDATGRDWSASLEIFHQAAVADVEPYEYLQEWLQTEGE